MPNDNVEPSVGRRDILKTAGVAGAAGLAGCTGGGDGGDGGGDGGDGGGDGGSTPTEGSSGDGGDQETETETAGSDLSGVNFEYWNIINIQTRNARDLSEAAIQEFEDSTGASISTNFSSYTDLAGAKWINRFKSENYPVLYDAETFLSGHLVDGGWVLPASEYVDRFEDQDMVDALEWITSGPMEYSYRGLEGNGMELIKEWPFGLDVRQPNIRLKPHFEQAGLSTEYGPLHEGVDDLIENSKTLKEEGPAEITCPVFGASHDWCDVNLAIWTTIAGQVDGLLINEDWSEPNFTNDIWTEIYTKYVNIHLEHGLSSPQTPTLPDEDSVPEMIAGNWSQSWADPFNHGGFARQAPDMMDSGEIYYNPHWEGPGGNGLPFGVMTLGLTKPPEGADENNWERKQDAAIKFMEKMDSVEFQNRTFDGFGFAPARQESWDNIERSSHHLMDFYEDTMGHENTEYSIAAHPQMPRIYSTMNAPFSQEVLKENTSIEDGLQQMYDETSSNLGRWAE